MAKNPKRCTLCAGIAAKGSALDDTLTGKVWVCAGCVIEHQLAALKANVGELQRQHHELVGTAFSGSLDAVGRARAGWIAEGMARAVKALTGSEMSDHRDASALAAELMSAPDEQDEQDGRVGFPASHVSLN